MSLIKPTWDHLSVPKSDRNYLWRDHFYKNLPTGGVYQANIGLDGKCTAGIFNSPEGRPHLYVKLLHPNWRERATVPFDSVIDAAFHNACGVAIFTDNDSEPAATLRYGSVWSYKEYKNLSGTYNQSAEFDSACKIDPNNPFDAIAKDTAQYFVSQPSEAFFPSKIRDIITTAIQKEYPEERPAFILITEEKYAMRYSIVVAMESLPEDKKRLQSDLTWYMPPYLPVSLGLKKNFNKYPGLLGN